jgi:hypothetical protein
MAVIYLLMLMAIFAVTYIAASIVTGSVAMAVVIAYAVTVAVALVGQVWKGDR